MEPWDPEYFLQFDEEEFPTIESTLRRLAQTQPIQASLEIGLMKESILLLEPLSVSGIPRSVSKLFRHIECEVSTGGVKRVTRLKIKANDGILISRENSFNAWEIMEYFGPTLVNFKIVGKYFFSSSLLCEYNIDFHGLWSATREAELNNDQWGMPYQFKVPASLPKLSSIATFSEQEDSHYIFQSAKSASVLSPTGNLKPPSKAIPLKPTLVTMKFRFRIVHLHNCVNLSSSLYLLPRTHEGDDLPRQSDLHRVAATGPDLLMREILSPLARNQQLRRALGLKDALDRCVFDVALAHQNFPVVRTLLERAGHLCFQGTQPQRGCAIHFAVAGGSVPCLKLLLKFLKRYCGSVNSGSEWTVQYYDMLEWVDALGYSPLAYACTKPGALSIVKALVDEGASVSLVSSVTKRTPLMLAVQTGDAELVDYLLSLRKSPYELLDDEIMEETSVFTVAGRRLISSSSIPESEAIESAAVRLRIRELRCLPAERDDTGYSAALLAARGGHVQIVASLLSLGLPLLDTTIHGDNFFHLSAMGGHTELCELLVGREREGWSRYKLKAGERSLLATMTGRTKLLMQRNTRGKRPADVAADNGFDSLAQTLREAAEDIYGCDTASGACAGLKGGKDIVGGSAGEAEQAEEKIPFDDAADEAEYSFAVAAKGGNSQTYYQIASIINAKDDDNAAVEQTSGAEIQVAPAPLLPTPPPQSNPLPTNLTTNTPQSYASVGQEDVVAVGGGRGGGGGGGWSRRDVAPSDGAMGWGSYSIVATEAGISSSATSAATREDSIMSREIFEGASSAPAPDVQSPTSTSTWMSTSSYGNPAITSTSGPDASPVSLSDNAASAPVAPVVSTTVLGTAPTTLNPADAEHNVTLR